MKTLFSILFLLSLYHQSIAQDSIRIINGKVLTGTVKTVSPYEVTYRKQARPGAAHAGGNQPYRKLSASEITEIIYADGRRDSVLPVKKLAADSGTRYFSKKDFYRLGANDAKLYYNVASGASTGTFLATFPGSPVLGLCVAVATSATRPVPSKFTYPNPAFAENDDYRAGYAKKAHGLKAGKVWTSWALGTAMTALTYLILSSRL